jgi:hypothetical protein
VLTAANAVTYITKTLVTFQFVLKSRSDLSYETMSTVSTFFCNLRNEKQEREDRIVTEVKAPVYKQQLGIIFCHTTDIHPRILLQ